MKQSKLRRRRVFRFAVLYFVLFIVFMGLMIAPVFVGEKLLSKDITDKAGDVFGMNLYQPNGQDNDDTNFEEPTGIKSPNYSGKFKSTESTPIATGAPKTDTTDPEKADP